MDRNAVWKATDSDLMDLGLSEKGDVICLKSFSMPSSTSDKTELVKKIKTAGQERIPPKEPVRKSRAYKTVHLGWMAYDDAKQKYVSVRTNKGGGSRDSNDANAAQILDKAKSLFIQGVDESQYKIELGNFQEKVIPADGFVLNKYIQENRLTKTRLYLMTKKLSSSQYISNIAKSCRKRTRRTTTLWNEDSDFDVNDALLFKNPIVDLTKDISGCSSSSSTFHETLQEPVPIAHSTTNFFQDSNAINQYFDPSPMEVSPGHQEKSVLPKDIPAQPENLAKTIVLDEQPVIGFGGASKLNNCTDKVSSPKLNETLTLTDEKKEALFNSRKRRVPPEPLDTTGVSISVRHPEIGTLRRLFERKSSMTCVYDWVGSLSSNLVYFNLVFNGERIQPFAIVETFKNVVLNVDKTDIPPFFEEDKEISVSGFSALPDKDEKEVFLSEIEDRRAVASLKLKTEKCFEVHRSNIANELFDIFSSIDTTSDSISFTIHGEKAKGDGVTKDVYTSFYKDLFANFASGINSNVPIGLPDEKLEILGKIISHGFIQHNIFPLELSKASFEYMITKDVRAETLFDSFLEFVQKTEASALKKLHRGLPLNEKENDMIIEALCDSGINALPNGQNIQRLIQDAAMNVFVKKPYFTLSKLRAGLGDYWDNVSVGSIDYLWKRAIPTPENVLGYLSLDEVITPLEEQIASYIKRFVNGASR